MQDFKKFATDVPLFVEAGMIAIKQGDEASAQRLFDAVDVLSSDKNLKKMGYGLIAMHKMDVAQAEKNFREIYEAEPKNFRARVFLAFTHLLAVTKSAEGSKAESHLKELTFHAQEVAKLAPDESTRNFAKTILDWEKELHNNSGKKS